MKIGFALFPERKNATTFPHINASNMALPAATNVEEDARLVLHEMSKKDLKSYYADWGAVIFFQKKKSFFRKESLQNVGVISRRERIGLCFLFV